jgi:hypothetical protein
MWKRMASKHGLTANSNFEVFFMRKLVFFGMLASAAFVNGQTFTSTQSDIRIPLPGQSGGTTITTSPAQFYPITFTVSGAGALTDLNITLNFGTRESTNTTVGGPDDFAGREHTFAGDMDMLLVGPTGATVFFMSDAGNANNLNGTYTFDDEAAAPMSASTIGTTDDSVANGSYQVSAYTPTETFFTPAPAGPYGTTLSVFDGLNPNGTWALYIMDDAGGDWGYLNNAQLNITAVPEPGSMLALAAGLALVAARRRRRS